MRTKLLRKLRKSAKRLVKIWPYDFFRGKCKYKVEELHGLYWVNNNYCTQFFRNQNAPLCEGCIKRGSM
jgi:hypothetical protein